MALFPIYSTQLATAPSSPIGAYFYTVPQDGTVWVVRDMEFLCPFNLGRLATGFQVAVRGQGTIWTVTVGQALGGMTSSWRGRAVLQSGQELAIQTQDNGWAWVISGYQFTPTLIRTR